MEPAATVKSLSPGYPNDRNAKGLNACSALWHLQRGPNRQQSFERVEHLEKRGGEPYPAGSLKKRGENILRNAFPSFPIFIF